MCGDGWVRATAGRVWSSRGWLAARRSAATVARMPGRPVRSRGWGEGHLVSIRRRLGEGAGGRNAGRYTGMTRTASSEQPGAFRLPGRPCSGFFTHVAAERDRLRRAVAPLRRAQRLGSTVGAEISGVDLAKDSRRGRRRNAPGALRLQGHLFRDQPDGLPQQHVAFARRFGDLEVHPFLPSNTGEPGSCASRTRPRSAATRTRGTTTSRGAPARPWVRSASSPCRTPEATRCSPTCTPPTTDWTRRPGTRSTVCKRCTTSPRRSGTPCRRRAGRRPRRSPPVRHPVVCTHPATGKLHHSSIGPSSVNVGLDRASSLALLDRLCRQADAPSTRPVHLDQGCGGVLDNRAVQHYASSDYSPSAAPWSAPR